MYIGTQDVNPRGQTPLPNIDGVTFIGEPMKLAFDPSEPDHLQFVGFGPFFFADGAAPDGGLNLASGEARGIMLAATSTRVVFAITDAEVGGKRIDLDRTGTLFAGEVPLESFSQITVANRKTLTGKVKPSRVLISSPLFGVAFEPVVILSDTGPQRTKDNPWPLAQQLVDLVLARRGFGPEERSNLLQNGWAQDEDGGTVFDFMNPAQPGGQPLDPTPPPVAQPPAQSEQPVDAPPPPPAAQIAQTTEIPRPPLDPSRQQQPVMPIYVAADAYSLQQPDVYTSLAKLWGRLGTTERLNENVRLGCVTYGSQVNLEEPLAHPGAAVPTFTPPAGDPNHAELLDFLPQLIDHDMDWFKGEAIPTLRPLLIVLSGSPSPFPYDPHTKLVNDSWRFRPNLVVVGTSPATTPETSATAEFDVRPLAAGQSLIPAFDVLETAIFEAAESLSTGGNPGLRFPDSLPGFRTANKQ